MDGGVQAYNRREDDDERKIGPFPKPSSKNQARLRVYTLRARNSDPAAHDAQIVDLDTGRSVIRLVPLDMNASSCRLSLQCAWP